MLWSERLLRILVQEFDHLTDKPCHDATARKELRPGPAIVSFLFDHTRARISRKYTSFFNLLNGFRIRWEIFINNIFDLPKPFLPLFMCACHNNRIIIVPSVVETPSPTLKIRSPTCN